MTYIVDCQGISKRFGSTQILNSLSFSVIEKELFFLLGPSGCGKTTLLRIIAGLAQQDSGSLKILGIDSGSVVPEKRGVGMVFQNYALWPHLSVKQHVEFGLRNSKMTSLQLNTRVSDVLEVLQIKELSSRYPHELSGGQQQRVSLARALAPQPKLVLLDEPLSNLDPSLREEMRHELKRIQRELELTFIYVTHDRTEALSMGDRIAIIKDGQLEQIGKPLDLFFKPKNSFVASFLGETNLLSGRIGTNQKGQIGIISEIGFIESPLNITFNNNDRKLNFSVRPEDLFIEIKNEDSSNDTMTYGVITELIPIGAVSLLNVNTTKDKNVVCAVSMRDSLRYQEGMQVSIQTSWDRICLLED